MRMFHRARQRAIALVLLVTFANSALAANFTVANTNDSGNGSLRDIIETPQASSGDTVLFNAALAGQTIGLISTLTVTQNPITVQLDVGALTISNAAGSVDIAGSTTLNTVANTDILTVTSPITGVGSLIKIGTGQVILSGTNTYSGGTTVNAGRVTGTTASVQGQITNNGQVEFNQAVNGTYAGTMSGATGQLIKDGAGTVTLTGPNVYGGGTTVIGGVLAGDATSIQGDITNNATVQFNQTAAAGTYAGNMSGTGSLVSAGTNTLRLSGTNTYSGATSITAGTLQAANGLAIGDASAVTVGAGATLQLINSETIGSLAGAGSVDVQTNVLTAGGDGTSTTFSGGISGTGTLIKSGAGTLTLSGINTFSGVLGITAGVVLANNGAAIADTALVDIGPAGSLRLGSTETIGALSGSGGISLGINTLIVGDARNTTFSGRIDGSGGFVKNGTGTLNLSGANNYSGATIVNTGVLLLTGGAAIADTSAVSAFGLGTVRLASSETLGSIAGDGTFDLQGNTLSAGSLNTNTIVTGNIIGAGGVLDKQGNGTLRLTGANTYSGGTNVQAGTLEGDTNGIQGNIVLSNSTQVRFDQGVAGTYGGNISGVGRVVKVNAGNLTMTGVNSYSGGTIVSAGTLTGNSLALQGNIANSAAVVFDQAVAGTYSGVMSGTGSLTKLNAGTLTLTAANTYSGGTTVTGGTLRGNATSLQGRITDNAIVNFNQDAAGTYSSVMSGAGVLLKTGGGNLTLTGANTYAGGTVVAAGTLTGNTTSLQGAIANAAAVAFDQAVTGTYAGVISGTGTVTKRGAGTLKFTGANTYTGLTSVNAGRFEIDGSLAGDADVAAGAVLGGRGSVKNLIVRGKLSPGNSIGTVSVAGNLTQVGGSSFDVEIDPVGNSDKVVVGGTTTINPGVTLNVISTGGTYSAGQQYTILTSAGGISGAYSTVTDDLQFLDVSVLQSTNAIMLELIRNVAAITNAATSLNERGVAFAIAPVAPRANGDFGAVLDVINPLNANQIRDALEQLGGEIHADMPSLVLQDFTTVNHTVSRRLRTITPAWVDAPAPAAGGPAAAAAAAGAAAAAAPYAGIAGLGNDTVKDPWSAWGEGYGFHTGADGDGNARGLSFDGHGGMIGLDRAFGLRSLGGVFLGSGRTSAQLDGRLDNANIESKRLGVYGRHECEGFNLTGVLSWADNDFDVSRRLLIGGIDRQSRALYGGHGISAYVEASTNLKHQGWDIQPTASLQYAHIQDGGFGETGANSLDLIGSQVRADSMLGSLGARVTYPTETSKGRTLVPELRARWMHEFHQGDARLFTASLAGAPANPFTVVGANLGRNFAVLGAGLTYQTGDRSHLFASYDAQLNGQQQTHTGEAGFRIAF